MAENSVDAKKAKGKITDRIERGRERLSSLAASTDEAWEFYRGNHFARVDEKNVLRVMKTITNENGTGKPRWRSRQSRPLVHDLVQQEAAAATARTPSYDVVPTSHDPERIAAAKLSKKLALYGHDKWDIREVMRDAVVHACVGGEAFAWTYFDNTIGPFVDDGNGSVGLGEVRVHIYGKNECYWEPGLRFEESGWHVIEQAREIENVKASPDYTGPDKLTPDANARALSMRRNSGDKAKLVLVSEYLERPSPEYPEGRWITVANGKPISKMRPYPGDDPSSPCLRKLSWAVDPDADRDIGLVSLVLDAQRTIDDATNKLIEWKNLCLMPQWVAHPGVLGKQKRTDEPGKVYTAMQPNENIKVIDPPKVPQELFQIIDQAKQDMDRIAAAGVRDPSQFESGKEAQIFDTAAGNRKASFLADLAEFYAGVMHDCLSEVQKGYSEPRLIQVTGRFGPDPQDGFLGSQLYSELDVRVNPDSIMPRTRDSVEQRVMNYATLGWITPEQAMAAIDNGTAEGLIDSYELAYERVNRIIQRIKDGTFAGELNPATGKMEVKMRPVLAGEDHKIPLIDPKTGQTVQTQAPDPQPDPATGMPDPNAPPAGAPVPVMVPATEVPDWMPRPFDRISVHKQQMEDWMQTSDWDDLPPPAMEAANLYYAALLDIESKNAQRAAEMQYEQASGLGMQNASKPGDPPVPPSLPKTSPSGDSQKDGSKTDQGSQPQR